MAGRLGQQLMAIAAEGNRRQVYLAPDIRHSGAADATSRRLFRLEKCPRTRWFSPPNYGMASWSDLFTSRQLVVNYFRISSAKPESKPTLVHVAGLSPDQAEAYGATVATYLGLGASRLTDVQIHFADGRTPGVR